MNDQYGDHPILAPTWFSDPATKHLVTHFSYGVNKLKEKNIMPALRWMAPPNAESPFTAIYRNCFAMEKETVLEFEYSADKRTAFFPDGQWIWNGMVRRRRIEAGFDSETMKSHFLKRPCNELLDETLR